MPYFEKENLKMYYEDVGKGEPIITIHGLLEDGSYWTQSGVTAALVEKDYRLINIDMRGHSRTVVREPYGFDADTMAKDFDDLADYLGIEKFHLLSHATGGMVAARYAMTRSERLISLMQTDTGSSTQPEMVPSPTRKEETPPPDGKLTELQINVLKAADPDMTKIPASLLELTPDQINILKEAAINVPLEDRIAAHKGNPDVFMFKLAEHPDSERLWNIYYSFWHRHDWRQALNFQWSFYTDPNPRIEQLRQIKCPTLVLLGEFDLVFLKESEIMAKEIPDARHVIMKGLGHMTALEAPDRLITELLDFLDGVKQTGKSNR
ncbi:MAG: alpha/beta fold hydrolase [Promethearchaeota archaeon]|jgi:pimeloyl-ACP methyl ester carboxylesterase